MAGRTPACHRARAGYNSHVEKATVSELKNNLSAYLRKVRSGQPVLIYDRDVPNARIERIESSGRGVDRLALLASQGITRPATRPPAPRELQALLPRPLPRSAGVLDALLEERAHGR
jgi:antitoxin (DNA-binding transcriptional repressor) of toxin-antitoxin stability system